MFLDLNEISKLRKKLGLTQKELARLSQVSQSFIAKIEAGKIDPSYNIVKRIFSVLLELNTNNDIKAKQIMTRRLISVSENEKLKSAIEKMRRFKISQLPVLRGDSVVGLISENNLVETISSNKDSFDSLKISDIMQDAPPIITPNTSLTIIVELLKQYPIIIVSHKGKIQGVITKSDIINVVTLK